MILRVYQTFSGYVLDRACYWEDVLMRVYEVFSRLYEALYRTIGQAFYRTSILGIMLPMGAAATATNNATNPSVNSNPFTVCNRNRRRYVTVRWLLWRNIAVPWRTS